LETHALSHSHLRQTSESTVESDTAAAGANSSTQSTLETHAVSAAEYEFEEVKRREAHPGGGAGEDVVVKDWTATESAGTLRGYELDSTTTVGGDLDGEATGAGYGFDFDMQTHVYAVGAEADSTWATKTVDGQADGSATTVNDERLRDSWSHRAVEWETVVPISGTVVLQQGGTPGGGGGSIRSGSFSADFSGSRVDDVADTWRYDNGVTSHGHTEYHYDSRTSDVEYEFSEGPSVFELHHPSDRRSPAPILPPRPLASISIYMYKIRHAPPSPISRRNPTLNKQPLPFPSPWTMGQPPLHALGSWLSALRSPPLNLNPPTTDLRQRRNPLLLQRAPQDFNEHQCDWRGR
jgi:hypothetical protein